MELLRRSPSAAARAAAARVQAPAPAAPQVSSQISSPSSTSSLILPPGFASPTPPTSGLHVGSLKIQELVSPVRLPLASSSSMVPDSLASETRAASSSSTAAVTAGQLGKPTGRIQDLLRPSSAMTAADARFDWAPLPGQEASASIRIPSPAAPHPSRPAPRADELEAGWHLRSYSMPLLLEARSHRAVYRRRLGDREEARLKLQSRRINELSPPPPLAKIPSHPAPNAEAEASTPLPPSPPLRPSQPPPLRLVMPLPGDPKLRPEEGHLVIDSTPALEQAVEGLARHAAVIRLGGTRPRANANDVAAVIAKRANLPRELFRVVPFYPEDFFITFTHGHHRDSVVNEGRFEADGLDVHVHKWSKLAHADAVALNYHVHLCLEGVPFQAWNGEAAGKLIGKNAVLHYFDIATTQREDATAMSSGPGAPSRQPFRSPEAASPTAPAAFDTPCDSFDDAPTPVHGQGGSPACTPASSSPVFVASPGQDGACDDGLTMLFAERAAPLLSPPSPRPSPPAARRKTLAGVKSFNLQRSTARLNKKGNNASMAVLAEKFLCKRMGILKEGEMITEQAIAKFAALFHGKLPTIAVDALRALFRLDCDLATVVEEALLAHGGHAVLDQADEEATASLAAAQET
ncbi:hypothetical protein ACQ4PT_040629 [Festuca glaucescens]